MLSSQGKSVLGSVKYKGLQYLPNVGNSDGAKKSVSANLCLEPYFEDKYTENHSDNIAKEILRYIKQTRNFEKDTATFVENIRNKVIFLHYYGCKVAEVTGCYPLSSNFVHLLRTYIILECKVLENKLYYSRSYENEVRRRLSSLLQTVYGSYHEYKNVLSSQENYIKDIIHLLMNLWVDYDVRNSVTESIAEQLLGKVGDLEKVTTFIGIPLPCKSDSYFNKSRDYIDISRKYCTRFPAPAEDLAIPCVDVEQDTDCVLVKTRTRINPLFKDEKTNRDVERRIAQNRDARFQKKKELRIQRKKLFDSTCESVKTENPNVEFFFEDETGDDIFNIGVIETSTLNFLNNVQRLADSVELVDKENNVQCSQKLPIIGVADKETNRKHNNSLFMKNVEEHGNSIGTKVLRTIDLTEDILTIDLTELASNPEKIKLEEKYNSQEFVANDSVNNSTYVFPINIDDDEEETVCPNQLVPEQASVNSADENAPITKQSQEILEELIEVRSQHITYDRSKDWTHIRVIHSENSSYSENVSQLTRTAQSVDIVIADKVMDIENPSIKQFKEQLSSKLGKDDKPEEDSIVILDVESENFVENTLINQVSPLKPFEEPNILKQRKDEGQVEVFGSFLNNENVETSYENALVKYYEEEGQKDTDLNYSTLCVHRTKSNCSDTSLESIESITKVQHPDKLIDKLGVKSMDIDEIMKISDSNINAEEKSKVLYEYSNKTLEDLGCDKRNLTGILKYDSTNIVKSPSINNDILDVQNDTNQTIEHKLLETDKQDSTNNSDIRENSPIYEDDIVYKKNETFYSIKNFPITDSVQKDFNQILESSHENVGENQETPPVVLETCPQQDLRSSIVILEDKSNKDNVADCSVIVCEELNDNFAEQPQKLMEDSTVDCKNQDVTQDFATDTVTIDKNSRKDVEIVLSKEFKQSENIETLPHNTGPKIEEKSVHTARKVLTKGQLKAPYGILKEFEEHKFMEEHNVPEVFNQNSVKCLHEPEVIQKLTQDKKVTENSTRFLHSENISSCRPIGVEISFIYSEDLNYSTISESFESEYVLEFNKINNTNIVDCKKNENIEGNEIVPKTTADDIDCKKNETIIKKEIIPRPTTYEHKANLEIIDDSEIYCTKEVTIDYSETEVIEKTCFDCTVENSEEKEPPEPDIFYDNDFIQPAEVTIETSENEVLFDLEASINKFEDISHNALENVANLRFESSEFEYEPDILVTEETIITSDKDDNQGETFRKEDKITETDPNKMNSNQTQQLQHSDIESGNKKFESNEPVISPTDKSDALELDQGKFSNRKSICDQTTLEETLVNSDTETSNHLNNEEDIFHQTECEKIDNPDPESEVINISYQMRHKDTELHIGKGLHQEKDIAKIKPRTIEIETSKHFQDEEGICNRSQHEDIVNNSDNGPHIDEIKISKYFHTDQKLSHQIQDEETLIHSHIKNNRVEYQPDFFVHEETMQESDIKLFKPLTKDRCGDDKNENIEKIDKSEDSNANIINISDERYLPMNEFDEKIAEDKINSHIFGICNESDKHIEISTESQKHLSDVESKLEIDKKPYIISQSKDAAKKLSVVTDTTGTIKNKTVSITDDHIIVREKSYLTAQTLECNDDISLENIDINEGQKGKRKMKSSNNKVSSSFTALFGKELVVNLEVMKHMPKKENHFDEQLKSFIINDQIYMEPMEAYNLQDTTNKTNSMIKVAVTENINVTERILVPETSRIEDHARLSDADLKKTETSSKVKIDDCELTPRDSTDEQTECIYKSDHINGKVVNLQENEKRDSENVNFEDSVKIIVGETAVSKTEMSRVDEPAYRHLQEAQHHAVEKIEEKLTKDKIQHIINNMKKEVPFITGMLPYNKKDSDELGDTSYLLKKNTETTDFMQITPTLEIIRPEETDSRFLVMLANVADEVSKKEKSPKINKRSQIYKQTRAPKRNPRRKYITNLGDIPNKRVTRSAITKSSLLNFKPHDFLSLDSSTRPPPANKVYIQKVSDISLNSENSNDSECNNLFIDEDIKEKFVEKIKEPTISVYDDDSLEEPLQMCYTHRVQGTVTISIPEMNDNEFELLKQMEELAQQQNVCNENIDNPEMSKLPDKIDNDIICGLDTETAARKHQEKEYEMNSSKMTTNEFDFITKTTVVGHQLIEDELSLFKTASNEFEPITKTTATEHQLKEDELSLFKTTSNESGSVAEQQVKEDGLNSSEITDNITKNIESDHPIKEDGLNSSKITNEFDSITRITVVEYPVKEDGLNSSKTTSNEFDSVTKNTIVEHQVKEEVLNLSKATTCELDAQQGFDENVSLRKGEYLSNRTSVPFRTMAARKEFSKLNPYVSIERLSKLKNFEEEHSNSSQNGAVDIKINADHLLCEEIQRNISNAQDFIDNLPLSTLKHKLKTKSNKNKDCDSKLVELNINENYLKKQPDEKKTNVLRRKSFVFDRNELAKEPTNKIIETLEPLVSAEEQQTNSDISMNLKKTFFNEHRDEVMDTKIMEAEDSTTNENEKYYRIPKLRRKSMSKCNLNRIASEPDKVPAHNKTCLLLPKLRQKPNIDVDLRTETLDQMKPILSNCKSTVTETTEKLMKKLESDLHSHSGNMFDDTRSNEVIEKSKKPETSTISEHHIFDKIKPTVDLTDIKIAPEKQIVSNKKISGKEVINVELGSEKNMKICKITDDEQLKQQEESILASGMQSCSHRSTIHSDISKQNSSIIAETSGNTSKTKQVKIICTKKNRAKSKDNMYSEEDNLKCSSSSPIIYDNQSKTNAKKTPQIIYDNSKVQITCKRQTRSKSVTINNVDEDIYKSSDDSDANTTLDEPNKSNKNSTSRKECSVEATVEFERRLSIENTGMLKNESVCVGRREVSTETSATDAKSFKSVSFSNNHDKFKRNIDEETIGSENRAINKENIERTSSEMKGRPRRTRSLSIEEDRKIVPKIEAIIADTLTAYNLEADDNKEKVFTKPENDFKKAVNENPKKRKTRSQSIEPDVEQVTSITAIDEESIFLKPVIARLRKTKRSSWSSDFEEINNPIAIATKEKEGNRKIVEQPKSGNFAEDKLKNEGAESKPNKTIELKNQSTSLITNTLLGESHKNLEVIGSKKSRRSKAFKVVPRKSKNAKFKSDIDKLEKPLKVIGKSLPLFIENNKSETSEDKVTLSEKNICKRLRRSRSSNITFENNELDSTALLKYEEKLSSRSTRSKSASMALIEISTITKKIEDNDDDNQFDPKKCSTIISVSMLEHVGISDNMSHKISKDKLQKICPTKIKSKQDQNSKQKSSIDKPMTLKDQDYVPLHGKSECNEVSSPTTKVIKDNSFNKAGVETGDKILTTSEVSIDTAPLKSETLHKAITNTEKIKDDELNQVTIMKDTIVSTKELYYDNKCLKGGKKAITEKQLCHDTILASVSLSNTNRNSVNNTQYSKYTIDGSKEIISSLTKKEDVLSQSTKTTDIMKRRKLRCRSLSDPNVSYTCSSIVNISETTSDPNQDTPLCNVSIPTHQIYKLSHKDFATDDANHVLLKSNLEKSCEKTNKADQLTSPKLTSINHAMLYMQGSNRVNKTLQSEKGAFNTKQTNTGHIEGNLHTKDVISVTEVDKCENLKEEPTSEKKQSRTPVSDSKRAEMLNKDEIVIKDICEKSNTGSNEVVLSPLNMIAESNKYQTVEKDFSKKKSKQNQELFVSKNFQDLHKDIQISHSQKRISKAKKSKTNHCNHNPNIDKTKLTTENDKQEIIIKNFCGKTSNQNQSSPILSKDSHLSKIFATFVTQDSNQGVPISQSQIKSIKLKKSKIKHLGENEQHSANHNEIKTSSDCYEKYNFKELVVSPDNCIEKISVDLSKLIQDSSKKYGNRDATISKTISSVVNSIDETCDKTVDFRENNIGIQNKSKSVSFTSDRNKLTAKSYNEILSINIDSENVSQVTRTAHIEESAPSLAEIASDQDPIKLEEKYSFQKFVANDSINNCNYDIVQVKTSNSPDNSIEKISEDISKLIPDYSGIQIKSTSDSLTSDSNKWTAKSCNHILSINIDDEETSHKSETRGKQTKDNSAIINEEPSVNKNSRILVTQDLDKVLNGNEIMTDSAIMVSDKDLVIEYCEKTRESNYSMSVIVDGSFAVIASDKRQSVADIANEKTNEQAQSTSTVVEEEPSISRTSTTLAIQDLDKVVNLNETMASHNGKHQILNEDSSEKPVVHEETSVNGRSPTLAIQDSDKAVKHNEIISSAIMASVNKLIEDSSEKTNEPTQSTSIIAVDKELSVDRYSPKLTSQDLDKHVNAKETRISSAIVASDNNKSDQLVIEDSSEKINKQTQSTSTTLVGEESFVPTLAPQDLDKYVDPNEITGSSGIFTSDNNKHELLIEDSREKTNEQTQAASTTVVGEEPFVPTLAPQDLDQYVDTNDITRSSGILTSDNDKHVKSEKINKPNQSNSTLVVDEEPFLPTLASQDLDKYVETKVITRSSRILTSDYNKHKDSSEITNEQTESTSTTVVGDEPFVPTLSPQDFDKYVDPNETSRSSGILISDNNKHELVIEDSSEKTNEQTQAASTTVVGKEPFVSTLALQDLDKYVDPNEITKSSKILISDNNQHALVIEHSSEKTNEETQAASSTVVGGEPFVPTLPPQDLNKYADPNEFRRSSGILISDDNKHELVIEHSSERINEETQAASTTVVGGEPFVPTLSPQDLIKYVDPNEFRRSSGILIPDNNKHELVIKHSSEKTNEETQSTSTTVVGEEPFVPILALQNLDKYVNPSEITRSSGILTSDNNKHELVIEHSSEKTNEQTQAASTTVVGEEPFVPTLHELTRSSGMLTSDNNKQELVIEDSSEKMQTQPSSTIVVEEEPFVNSCSLRLAPQDLDKHVESNESSAIKASDNKHQVVIQDSREKTSEQTTSSIVIPPSVNMSSATLTLQDLDDDVNLNETMIEKFEMVNKSKEIVELSYSKSDLIQSEEVIENKNGNKIETKIFEFNIMLPENTLELSKDSSKKNDKTKSSKSRKSAQKNGNNIGVKKSKSNTNICFDIKNKTENNFTVDVKINSDNENSNLLAQYVEKVFTDATNASNIIGGNEDFRDKVINESNMTTNENIGVKNKLHSKKETESLQTSTIDFLSSTHVTAGDIKENEHTKLESILKSNNRKRKSSMSSSNSATEIVKKIKLEGITIDTSPPHNHKSMKQCSPLSVSPGRKEKKSIESIINHLKENTNIQSQDIDVSGLKKKLSNKMQTNIIPETQSSGTEIVTSYSQYDLEHQAQISSVCELPPIEDKLSSEVENMALLAPEPNDSSKSLDCENIRSDIPLSQMLLVENVSGKSLVHNESLMMTEENMTKQINHGQVQCTQTEIIINSGINYPPQTSKMRDSSDKGSEIRNVEMHLEERNFTFTNSRQNVKDGLSIENSLSEQHKVENPSLPTNLLETFEAPKIPVSESDISSISFLNDMSFNDSLLNNVKLFNVPQCAEEVIIKDSPEHADQPLIDSVDVSILSKMITTMADTLLSPTSSTNTLYNTTSNKRVFTETVSSAKKKCNFSYSGEQAEGNDSQTIPDSLNFQDISPCKLFIDNNQSLDRARHSTEIIEEIADHNYFVGGPLLSGRQENTSIFPQNCEHSKNLEIQCPLDDKKMKELTEFNDNNLSDISDQFCELLENAKQENVATDKMNLDSEYAEMMMAQAIPISNNFPMAQATPISNNFPMANYNLEDIENISFIDCETSEDNSSCKDTDYASNDDAWSRLFPNADSTPKVTVIQNEELVPPYQFTDIFDVCTAKVDPPAPVPLIEAPALKPKPEFISAPQKKTLIADRIKKAKTQEKTKIHKPELQLMLPTRRYSKTPVPTPHRKSPSPPSSEEASFQQNSLLNKVSVTEQTSTGDEALLIKGLHMNKTVISKVELRADLGPPEHLTFKLEKALLTNVPTTDNLTLPKENKETLSKDAIGKNDMTKSTTPKPNMSEKDKLLTTVVKSTIADVVKSRKRQAIRDLSSLMDTQDLTESASSKRSRKSPSQSSAVSPKLQKDPLKSAQALLKIAADASLSTKNDSTSKPSTPKLSTSNREVTLPINTDNLLKLKMKPVNREPSNVPSSNYRKEAHAKNKRSSSSRDDEEEGQLKMKKSENDRNKDQLFDKLLQQGNINPLLTRKALEISLPPGLKRPQTYSNQKTRGREIDVMLAKESTFNERRSEPNRKDKHRRDQNSNRYSSGYPVPDRRCTEIGPSTSKMGEISKDVRRHSVNSSPPRNRNGYDRPYDNASGSSTIHPHLTKTRTAKRSISDRRDTENHTSNASSRHFNAPGTYIDPRHASKTSSISNNSNNRTSNFNWKKFDPYFSTPSVPLFNGGRNHRNDSK